MRLGLRAKETVAITTLTCLIVATTTLAHLAQLTRVVVEEASRQAELIAQQIYAQGSRALARTPRGAPRARLREDPELRSLIEASVGYSPHLLYVLIDDEAGAAILHSEARKQGAPAPARPRLQELLALDPARRAYALYAGGTVYEAVLPLRLDNVPFGNIRLGISTTLLRRELGTSLGQAVTLAALALPVAWLVAMALANLVLKPVRQLTQEMARLRRGEFDVAPAARPSDELGQLASQIQELGRELHSDRLRMLSEKAHLQQAVDHLEDGLLFCTEDRRILFFNRAAEVVVGRPVHEAAGRPMEEVLDPAHPLHPLLEQTFQSATGCRNTTISLAVDGQSREFLVSVFFVKDAQKSMGAMVLMKDLGSLRTLQSLVSYSAKLTALGRLTSGVAHEVKNPLNAMMIHLELIKERLSGSPEDVRQSLEIIGSEIRRLDRVLQGFLKFVRPQELVLKSIDLNALLHDLVALLEPEWQPPGVQFRLECDPGLPRIVADDEMLRQAFLNILQNACQAMPTGGTVTLTTREESPELVRVIFTDEGVGIPPEDVDKIFKLYYTTKPQGNGIGLPVVYR
ncbi:MAG: ATP-binding protein, partial [Candidatus Rokuibacteriota bacterium]